MVFQDLFVKMIPTTFKAYRLAAYASPKADERPRAKHHLLVFLRAEHVAQQAEKPLDHIVLSAVHTQPTGHPFAVEDGRQMAARAMRSSSEETTMPVRVKSWLASKGSTVVPGERNAMNPGDTSYSIRLTRMRAWPEETKPKR